MPRRLKLLCAFCALVSVASSLPGPQGSARANDFPLADKVLVEKADRKLHLLKGGVAIRSFDIALGIRPVGDKEREGDFKTPEGNYLLDARNPDSEYFLAIHVSYPDSLDRACIAVSNSDMIDIWLMTAENTPIEIRP
jgi:hypothetical protein